MPFSSRSLLVLSLLSATAASAQDITLNDDGSVTLSGLAQPTATLSDSCSDVVCTANAFLDTLSDDQKAQVLLPMTVENATAWSNLPCGSSCRVGIEFTDLDDAQKSAALAVILAASGTAGFDEATQVMMADDILTMAQDAGLSSGPAGGPGGTPPDGATPPDGMTPPDGATPPDGGMGGGLAYSVDNYFIAFLGTPSDSGTWQLQFGGHHLGTLHTYVDGTETAATPNFIGIEPKVWTVDGTTYAPLTDDRDAMEAMLTALSADQLAAAKLDDAYSDVLLGPGKDGQFPETKVGLKVSELSDEQQALVTEAIAQWVADTADESAATIMAEYTADLDETYIAFSGNASLDQHADYVRIDGPDVWIEFVCQSGIVFGDQIHYHTIWRDHSNDYGAVYDF